MFTEIVTILGTTFGICVAFITIYEKLILKKKNEKLMSNLKSILKRGRFYLRWTLEIEILNFHGDAIHKNTVTYVNLNDEIAYKSSHNIWGSFDIPNNELEIWAKDNKGELETKILTDSPSYKRIAIQFRDGVTNDKPYSYTWGHKYPKEFANLNKLEWVEFEQECPVTDIKIMISLPKQSVVKDSPICYKIENGNKKPVEEILIKTKKGKPIIEFKDEKINAYTIFRIEFYAIQSN